MKDVIELRKFWQIHVSEPLLLCTLIRKSGSSYRALGAKKILSLSTGHSSGTLSGGCLEGDINRVALEGADRLPFTHRFSTLSDDDRLLGYQTGCSGVIEILFEKLPPHTEQKDLYFPFGSSESASGVEVDLRPGQIGLRKFVDTPFETNDEFFFDNWLTSVAVTIIGCGTDADPYFHFADLLGWNIQFIDYRSNLTKPDRFGNTEAQLVSIPNISKKIPDGKKSAVILMTHNYEADLQIFETLVGKDIGYLGCLGPRRRYELLKHDLQRLYNKTVPEDWENKIINSPPGVISRNYSPNEIAFSVIAEIQQKLGVDLA